VALAVVEKAVELALVPLEQMAPEVVLVVVDQVPVLWVVRVWLLLLILAHNAEPAEQ
jgi:hypothetical protein